MDGIKPQFEREVYEGWLKAGLGSPDQRERWRAAVDFYDREGAPSAPAPVAPDLFSRVVVVKPDPDLPGGLVVDVCGEDIPDPEELQVEIFDNLVFRADERGHGGGIRLWVLARAIDNGRGVVTRAELDSRFKMRLGERRYRRWLSDARRIGLLQEARSGRVLRLVKPERAARLMGCKDVGERPVLMPASKLIGRGWKSWIWACALLAIHNKTTTRKRGELFEIVQYISPVSRETLQELTGIPERTQRSLEKILPVKYIPNYAQTNTPGEYLGEVRQEGRAAFKRRVKGGGEVVAYRLPDSRRVKSPELVLGNPKKARWINAKLGGVFKVCAWPITGSTPAESGGCTSGSSQPQGLRGWPGPDKRRITRLFHHDPKAADRAARKLGAQDRTDVEEVFVEQRTRRRRVKWWSVDPLRVQYGI